MFERLLVPLDGSRLAESVLPVVKRLAKLASCSVMLLHIIEKRAPKTIHGDTHLQHVRDAELYLAGVAQELGREGLEVDYHVHPAPHGDVSLGIAEHASELDRDLIVLCSHGAGGVRRFVFGSNAEQVLTHGVTPVMFIQAVSPGTAPAFGPERILVLVEGTEATRSALKVSGELAARAGARLYLLSVVPTLSSMKAEQAATGRFIPSTTREVLDLAAEEAASTLRSEVDTLIAVRIGASGIVERGDPASAVIRAARALDADLVVLATRGLAGLSAFWADAIARKVAAAFTGALLLIPRERAERSTDR